MVTKLQAADLARRSGTTVVIARGDDSDILIRIVAGEKVGTRFHPVATAVESRKRYILTGGMAGGLTIDDGASKALRRGGSLLPVGVTTVEGSFERGDTVRVTDSSGREIARGMVNYTSADLAQIQRRRSEEIETLLGYNYGDEVIHRNDLVLL